MLANHNANLFLSELVEDLYDRAGGKSPKYELPIRVIDSPVLADEVFKNPDSFSKNYPFLEKLSQGRISTNGREWEMRSKLTQGFYHRSTSSVSNEKILDIYAKNFAKSIQSKELTLKKALIQSAVETIFLSYGFSSSPAWDLDVANDVVTALENDQNEAWINPAYNPNLVSIHLQNAYWKIKESWECDPIVKEFLENLGDAGYGIENFDPVGELIQNILSASETTAASLMWATEILGRNPSYQELLTSNNFSYLDFLLMKYCDCIRRYLW